MQNRKNFHDRNEKLHEPSDSLVIGMKQIVIKLSINFVPMLLSLSLFAFLYFVDILVDIVSGRYNTNSQSMYLNVCAVLSQFCCNWMATTVFWEFNQFSWGFLLIYNTIYYSMNKRRVKFVVSFATREDFKKKRLKRVTSYIFYYSFIVWNYLFSL